MGRGVSLLVLSICALSFATVTYAQSQSAPARALSLEISIVETDGARVNDISKMKPAKEEITRMISDGKIRLVASLEVRTRTGENFSARVGQRVPIQTATLPAMRTSDSSQPQGIAVGIPKIEYENTGLSVDGIATPLSDGLLDIKLKIEFTGLDPVTGRLTPAFSQRSFTDVVRMKESETVMLIGLVEPRPVLLDSNTSQRRNSADNGLVVLVTTKRIQ
jgi:type II secretory pathway component GspD/PulD (secretin)